MYLGEKPSHRSLQLCVKDLVHTVVISTPAHRVGKGALWGEADRKGGGAGGAGRPASVLKVWVDFKI